MNLLSVLPFAGLLSFALCGAGVGVRLMVLALRQRSQPALWMGLGLLSAGALGPACIVAAAMAGARDPSIIPLWWGLGLFVISLGTTFVYVFNARVFHAGSRIAAWSAAIAVAAMWLCLALSVERGGLARVGVFDPFGFLALAGRIGCFLWSAFASFDQFAKARRRQRLGMVEAAVVRRFAYWGTGAACAGSLLLTNLVRNLLGDSSPDSPVALTLVPGLGVAASACIALAFFPLPRWLTRLRRAPAPDAA